MAERSRATAPTHPLGDELLPAVYAELRRVARASMAGERNDHTLQPTALAHEAWLRLSRQHSVDPHDHDRVLSLAALCMRRILVEHARGRAAAKRNAQRKVPLSEDVPAVERDEYLLALDEALDDLARHDEQLARLVTYRFFGGFSVEETARLLDVSSRTVKRGWALARGWLHHRVTGGSA